jgi:large subunit ribosomal protein L5e
MGFVKVVKNKAYYKRFQVKYKRRRACKTDYYARRLLIVQDKNKYKTPKYRFVVRFTNKDIVCQIFSSDLTRDVCIASAYAHELPRYGVKAGLCNYAAAYCTGLLLARRVNTKFGLEFVGSEEVKGDSFNVRTAYDKAEEDDEDVGKAPFRAFLDVGLKRTTTGSKIFGALKGATDGGLDIPHNDRRFPGTTLEEGTKNRIPDPDKHRHYIFGGPVSDYMGLLEDDEDRYRKQFSRYTAAGINSGNLAKMYEQAHAAIRKDPRKKRGDLELGFFKTRSTKKPKEVAKKSFKIKRLTIDERKNRIKAKVAAIKAKNEDDARKDRMEEENAEEAASEAEAEDGGDM